MAKISPYYKKLKLDKIPWDKINLNKIPLNLIPLHKSPIKRIGSLLNKVFTKQEKKEGEKIINYIRIYTNLVNAHTLLNKEDYARAFNYATITKNLTRDFYDSSEKHYIDRINNIVADVLRKKSTIIRRLNRYEAADPAHAKTDLLLAQNICILRIMKISL